MQRPMDTAGTVVCEDAHGLNRSESAPSWSGERGVCSSTEHQDRMASEL